MLADISPLLVSLLFLPLFLLGIPLCTKAEKILGKSDPGEIIWDEFTVIPFIFLLIPDKFGAENQIESFIWLLAGFLIFRFFDILKPLGIKRLQALPGGMGVMIDDFVAALFSSVTLFAAKTFPLSFF
jgi:phosphatidylglycerophosphatase A